MPETVGPWEIGAYYEATPKLLFDRIERRNISIPNDVRAGTAVLCAREHKRFNTLLHSGRHFRDDTPLLVRCARFAYFHPHYGDGQFLATFDIEVGPQAPDHTPYLKKITSPLRVLALAGEGLVP